MFRVGQEFGSWEEFVKVKDAYEKSTFSTYVIEQSSTVENANKKQAMRGETGRYSCALRYQNVKLVCKHGGRKRIGKGKGIRPIQSTFKHDCPGFIHLIAKTKEKLRIVDLDLSHDNHELSEDNYNALPENRKINEEAMEKMKLLLKGGVKPGVVRSLLREVTPGFLTSRDIANMRAKWKAQELGGKTEEEQLLEVLEELQEKDPDCKISVGKSDEDDQMKFLFIQTKKMNENVTNYGNVILIDHTYKINKHRMPVTVFMVSDGRGQSRSAGYAFVADETLTTVTEVVQSFKDCLPEDVAGKVKTIVIDKDPSEIGAVKSVFPQAQVQLCRFHTSKTLKERSSKESPEVKQLLETLKNANTEEEFNQAVEQIEVEASPTFFKYLHDNWLCCPEAWANKDKKFSPNHGNSTTNRVENHNSKLKMMLASFMSLPEALRKLLELVANKEEDVVFATTVENLKETYFVANDKCPEANQLLKDLTKYAAKLQIWELSNCPTSEEIQYYKSSTQNCECQHRWSYELPCRHMYQCRRDHGLPVYSFSEIAEKWHKSADQCFTAAQSSGGLCKLRILTAQAPKTGQERYTVASQLCKELASMISNCGSNQFHTRMQVLKELQKIWAEGDEVAVLKIVNGVSLGEGQVSEQESTVITVLDCEGEAAPTSNEGSEPGNTSVGRISTAKSNKGKQLTACQLKPGGSRIVNGNLAQNNEEQLSEKRSCVTSVLDCEREATPTSNIFSSPQSIPSEPSDSSKKAVGVHRTAEDLSDLDDYLVLKPTTETGGRTDSLFSFMDYDADVDRKLSDLVDMIDELQQKSENLSPTASQEVAPTLSLSPAVASLAEERDPEPNSELPSTASKEAALSSSPAAGPSSAEERGPNCRCGIPSVRRKSRNNPNRQFWACDNFFKAQHCNFHQFTKSIQTDESKKSELRTSLAGVKIPEAVKCKGRPQGSTKTFQRKFSQTSNSKIIVAPPSGAIVTPFQFGAWRREKRGSDIPDKDVVATENGSFLIKSQTKNCDSVYTVTNTTCTCLDLCKPCKHIWKVRKLEESSTSTCCICHIGEPSHCCSMCHRHVHAIEPCSMAKPGAEEGFGQLRICRSCNGARLLQKRAASSADCSQDQSPKISKLVETQSSQSETPPKYSQTGRRIFKKKLFSPQ